MTPSPQSTDRQIRVFVSSTFRDMHAEREELVKRIFPQLRKMCEQRGVTWGEVDLRWGITDEQKAEGKVLPICLEEIKRCRPYFIGLLGERYGWIPDAIAPEVIEREPWLAEHREKSVTELEILHGVLNNPDMAEHAFFYFRDPAYVDSLPPDRKKDFATEGTEDTEKLRSLKDRIRTSGFPVRENYPDPKALGDLVLADLTAVIDKRWPEGSQPDPLDREAAEHEAFAQSRAGVYIGRREYFDRLDSHAAGDGLPLVILGESGVGKSALLANWALDYRKSHPDVLLIMHFIGASAYSADWAAMVRRIMGEFKRRFEIQQDIPDKPDELRLAFANWLHMAAAKGRVVLVLDALNQLINSNRAPDLLWLPPVMPENLRLIVSTLPGRPLDEIKKRAWPVLQVNLLDTDERRRLIEEYLAQYRKTLHTNQISRILACNQTANALYLRALLEELRLFGRYEKLDERIDYYLTAQTTPQLYEKILERYEQDYERDRPGLVRDAMSLIWASRRGLSEAELLELLGKNGEPLPRAYWSPLYLAMSDALVSRGGLLTFAHDFLRTAAMNAYLPTESHRRKTYLRLANYFEKQGVSLRQADELPWLLRRGGQHDRLRECLLNIDLFLLMRTSNQYELSMYWVWLGQQRIMGKPYLDSFEVWESMQPDNTAVAHAANQLGRFLKMAAQYDEAESLYKRALAIRETTLGKDHPDVAALLINLGSLYQSTNRLAEAESLYKRAMVIDETTFGKDHPNLVPILTNLASLYQLTNRLTEAEPLYKRALAIDETRFGTDHPDVARGLNNLAALYQEMNRLAEAEPLYKRVLAIDKSSLGKDHPNVAKHLYNLACLYEATNRLGEAELLVKRALAINETVLGKNHPDVAQDLNILAQLYQATNRLAEAQPLMERALTINETVLGKDHPDVAVDLNNLAQLYKVTNRLAEAEPLYKRALAISETSLGKDHPLVAAFLNNLGHLYYVTNRLAEAEPLYKRALAIDEISCGKDHPNVAIDLNNLALLYQETDHLAEAEPLMERMAMILLQFAQHTGHPHPHLNAAIDHFSELLQEMGYSNKQIRSRLDRMLQSFGMSLGQ